MKKLLLLLFIGFLLSHDNLDKLILKDGTKYFGKYSKIYKDKVLFRPKNESVYKLISIKKIELLKLEEGYIIILDGSDDIHIWGHDEELSFSDSRDILYLKSGTIYRGRYKQKINNKIIFLVIIDRLDIFKGYENYTKSFHINDIKTIIVKQGKLKYPFDLPKKWYLKQNSSTIKPSIRYGIAFLVYIAIMEFYSYGNSGKGILF